MFFIFSINMALMVGLKQDETGRHSDQFCKEEPFAGWGGKAHVLKPGQTPHVLT